MSTSRRISCLATLILCFLGSSDALLSHPYTNRVAENRHHHSISTRHVSKTTTSNHISKREKRSFQQSSTSLAAADERRPWELLRFISQSSKFVTLPPLLFTAKSQKRKIGVGEILFVAYHTRPDQEDWTITKLLSPSFYIQANQSGRQGILITSSTLPHWMTLWWAVPRHRT